MLYSAPPPSHCSRNHNRCCAKDNGNSAVRGAGLVGDARSMPTGRPEALGEQRGFSGLSGDAGVEIGPRSGSRLVSFIGPPSSAFIRGAVGQPTGSRLVIGHPVELFENLLQCGRSARRGAVTVVASSAIVGASNNMRTGQRRRNVAQPRQHLDRQQRMSAQVEEVVVDADLRSTENSCQISASSTASRGGVVRDPLASVVRGRQGLAIDLAIRKSGQVVEELPLRRHQCGRQARPEERAQLADRDRVTRPGHHVGDQRIVAMASLRPITKHACTAGCSSSTAFTSPGSTRTPRIFTWSSSRPRRSSDPSGR